MAAVVLNTTRGTSMKQTKMKLHGTDVINSEREYANCKGFGFGFKFGLGLGLRLELGLEKELMLA